ncbi:hypothetical protein [Blastococcus sp. PRF04-17]|uniref:hypothetical protein n=1 Tax=Blastococcus sp. PRF04-17 TaxID=2933797 RepID=UPI001FF5E554|nr:hypothetical protein [Blastococcus sp. PRF04-17]UOY03716.1 hypothetical protein MVA48_10455 [Blastococcus sp. PRF04-17]
MSTDLDVLRRYAADHHGVLTGAAAAALGVREAKLLDLVLAGELALIANDVYRHYDFITPLSEYAEAVALTGPGAVLADDAVLALHDLAQVNPRRLLVAVPHPLPHDARLPATVEVVVRRLAPEDVTEVEGIPTMTVAAALRACRGRVMDERLRHGVHRAAADGLLDAGTAELLRVEFTSPAVREQLRRNAEAEYALEAEFGLLSAAEVAQRAGATAADPERLMQDWRRQGRVFAVPVADGERLPGFQLDEHGDARPVIAEVLRWFDGRLSGWGLALWFTASNVWVDGQRPVDVLDSSPEMVVQAAAQLAAELPGEVPPGRPMPAPGQPSVPPLDDWES